MAKYFYEKAPLKKLINWPVESEQAKNIWWIYVIEENQKMWDPTVTLPSMTSLDRNLCLVFGTALFLSSTLITAFVKRSSNVLGFLSSISSSSTTTTSSSSSSSNSKRNSSAMRELYGLSEGYMAQLFQIVAQPFQTIGIRVANFAKYSLLLTLPVQPSFKQ